MAQDDRQVLCKPSDDQTHADPARRRCCIRWMVTFVLTLISISCLFIIISLVYPGCPLGSDVCHAQSPFTPEQLHLSLGATDNEYYVTWSTVQPVHSYLVWYEAQETPGQPVHLAAYGQRRDGLFESDNLQKRSHKYNKYSYHAAMQVKLNTKYRYKVITCSTDLTSKCDDALLPNALTLANVTQYSSKEYDFVAKPFDDPNRELKALFYGDLGLYNAQSVPRLTQEVNNNDLIIHNGDFAYDLNTNNGEYGDRFMRLMEPIAARIPYQTSVGNHEIAANFSEYNHRFTMVNRGAINHGEKNNFFYSFNAGPVHFIAFSTEFYYFIHRVGVQSLVHQYNWLKNDLEHASSLEERAKRPWIVVFGHRPMYCSNKGREDCTMDNNILRKGLPFVGGYALEKMFYDYGVDLEMYSHEHQYERFLPIYDGKVYNGSDASPYHNAEAPVHVISGSAGCDEKLDPFNIRPNTGSVVQISDYGYTRLRASKCQISVEQVSDDQDGLATDRFVLSKNRQRNFPTRGPELDCDPTQ